MQFNKNSGLVKVWVTLVLNGTYQVEHVPSLFNLKEVVSQVITEVTAQ